MKEQMLLSATVESIGTIIDRDNHPRLCIEDKKWIEILLPTLTNTQWNIPKGARIEVRFFWD